MGDPAAGQPDVDCSPPLLCCRLSAPLLSLIVLLLPAKSTQRVLKPTLSDVRVSPVWFLNPESVCLARLRTEVLAAHPSLHEHHAALQQIDEQPGKILPAPQIQEDVGQASGYHLGGVPLKGLRYIRFWGKYGGYPYCRKSPVGAVDCLERFHSTFSCSRALNWNPKP